MNHVMIDVWTTCDCAPAQNVILIINTLTGETECVECQTHGQLDQHELLEILNNLED